MAWTMHRSTDDPAQLVQRLAADAALLQQQYQAMMGKAAVAVTQSADHLLEHVLLYDAAAESLEVCMSLLYLVWACPALIPGTCALQAASVEAGRALEMLQHKSAQLHNELQGAEALAKQTRSLRRAVEQLASQLKMNG